MGIICWLERYTNVLTAVGTAGATVIALMAFFVGAIKRWWLKPRISILFKFEPPDCQIQNMDINKDGSIVETTFAMYYRVRIRNYGRQGLKNAQAYITKLEKQQSDGSFKELKEFFPIYLKWSHTETITMENISPEMERICDIGKIINPQKRILIKEENFPPNNTSETSFSFETKPKPKTLSYIIEKGTYKAYLIVGASNCRAIKTVLRIELDGKWVANEEEMLDQHSKITKLN